MGNCQCLMNWEANPFFTPNHQHPTLTQILSEYKFVSTYEDELFSRCSIIQHHQTKELIIAKEIRCRDEEEMHRFYAQFSRRKQTLICQHLVRLRYVSKSNVDGLCSDQFHLMLFFDYVFTSSLAQYGNRIKKRVGFSPQQINTIMVGAIKGYAALEENKVSNDKVRLRNIYFGIQNKSPITKIIDSKLFPTNNNLEAIRGRQGLTEDIFLSPEELKGTSSEKSGVFSLGMCLLQLCLLQPSKQLYNYSTNSINYKQIQTRLNIIRSKYPISIYYLIREMLQRNFELRPSFTRLSVGLPTNFKNLPTSVNLSMVGRSTEHINKQSMLMRSKLLPPIGNSKSSFRDGKTMCQTSLVSEYRPTMTISEVYRNGSVYVGQKRESLRHGKGKYIYKDGSYYYGDWHKGKMEGHGKTCDSKGKLQYEGEWRDDQYEGKGVLYGKQNCRWKKYEGQFRNGKMEGFGEMTFRDGLRYKGEFKGDLIWGKGRIFKKGGEVVYGIWERGQLMGTF